MHIEQTIVGQTKIAVVSGDSKVVTDLQSALDLMMTVKYQTDADSMALDKNLIIDDFFILSTGLAGEVLQKLINYHMKIAIYGDFTKYTSKPLKDFIYESNHGKDVFFVPTKEEALQCLRKADAVSQEF